MGSKPKDSRWSVYAIFLSEWKVMTSLFRRMVVRAGPERLSTRSICVVRSHTCQTLETEISSPALTTKVPV
jgi:hypothetical protein